MKMDRDVKIQKEHDGTYSVYAKTQYYLFTMRLGHHQFLKIGTVKRIDAELSFFPKPFMSSLSTRTMGDILSIISQLGENPRT